MKNIFFSLLILASGFIYSTNLKIAKKQDEEAMNLYIQDLEEENYYLKKVAVNKKYPNGWRIVKGLAGLWLGKKFFCSGSTGVFFLLIFPDDKLSETVLALSGNGLSAEAVLTHRFLWISLFSTITGFSVWVLKKSFINLYEGIYGIEDDKEYF